MSAKDGITQVKVFDHGLQLTSGAFLDAATEDEGERVGLAEGPIGIEETVSQVVQGGA
jgi:hypothetical protein